MFEKLGVTRMAQALAAHSGARLKVVARNIANSDTPGFRAFDTQDFASTYQKQELFSLQMTRPGHVESNPTEWQRIMRSGYGSAPNKNDVSLDQQMMKAAEVRQSHEMALAIQRSVSSVIRSALGRQG